LGVSRYKCTWDGVRFERNGEVVTDNAQLPGVPASGPIALQRHGSPIEFRNIAIKELNGE
jgi:hypothetical protein